MSVLGLEKILQPNSWWTTDTFNIIVLVGGFIAAIIGGMVCKVIARQSKAKLVLAAIVIVMGIGSAMANMKKPDPPVRTEPATMEGIGQYGKEPNWFAISKTVAAVIGLIIGSSLVKRRSPGMP
jgi:uncharacterized membrane protein YfcA